MAKEASRLRAIKICATGSLRSSSFLKGLERCEVPALRDLSLQALMGSVGSVLPLPSREIMVTNQLQRIQPSPFSKSGAPVRLRRLELRGMQVNLCAYSFSGLMSLSISWTSEGQFSNPSAFRVRSADWGLLDGKVTSAQFIELLQSSPILQDLSIDGGAIKSDELKPNFYATGARPSPASLPALTSLRVSSFNVPEQVANTLRLLRAPSLRVFRLRHMGNDLNNDGPTTDFDPLFDFLTGAGDHFGDFEYLQTLDVNCIELSSMNSFERFLCTLDNLKVFNVAYPESVAPPDDNMEDSCLRLFLSPSKRNNIGLPVLSSSLLCPNLKTIQASGISENALIDVVAARIEVGAPLRSLHCEEKLVEGVRDGLESRGMEPEVIAASAEEEPSKWHD